MFWADVGGGFFVNIDKILAIVNPNELPSALENILDLTDHDEIRSLIYLTNGQIILSRKSPEQIERYET